MKGIKSVDFLVEAVGEGIVNTNGACKNLKMPGQNGESVSNHRVPKIRNLSPTMIQDAGVFNGEHVVFVSSNCIRNKIFEEGQSIGEVNDNNHFNILTDFVGLLRGFMATSKTNMSAVRKSPVFMSDFAANTQLRFEQFSNSRGPDKNKLFSEHRPMGEIEYKSKGSISIEDLRFIPLEGTYGRSAYKSVITPDEIQKTQHAMSENIKSLASSLNQLSSEEKSRLNMHEDFNLEEIDVLASNNFVRKMPYKSSVSSEGEAGLLLNDKAIDVLVTEFFRRLLNLFITRSRGYLRVKSVIVDYNDGYAMRIENGVEYACKVRNKPYWLYYEDQAKSQKEYENKVSAQKEAEKKRKSNKAKKSGDTEQNQADAS